MIEGAVRDLERGYRTRGDRAAAHPGVVGERASGDRHRIAARGKEAAPALGGVDELRRRGLVEGAAGLLDELEEGTERRQLTLTPREVPLPT